MGLLDLRLGTTYEEDELLRVGFSACQSLSGVSDSSFSVIAVGVRVSFDELREGSKSVPVALVY